MVPPAPALDGLLRVTCTVSSSSSRASSATVTEMFFEMSPGAKVRVPLSRV